MATTVLRRIAAIVRVLSLLAVGLVWAATAAPHDPLFRSTPGVRSDRAAGIGKRVRPGGSLVLADLHGPGVIRHVWMTNVRQVEAAMRAGRVALCFTWDEHATPDVVVPVNDFFGTRFTASADAVFPMALGKNAYYPMPFRRAAKIELRNESDVELWGVYWQIDYDRVERLPDQAEYFTGQATFPAPPALGPGTQAETRRAEGRMLPPGATSRVVELEGPAVIRRFAVESAERAPDDVLTNRGVIVRMYWDGEAQPSVEAPLGDFFGTGFGERRDFRSAAWGQAGRRREILFPMPFRRSARIELVNLTGQPLGPFTCQAEYERDERLRHESVEYFHASFRISRPVPLNSTHVALETNGRGKFVGLVWSCHWLNAEQKPEGTQNFWVDGRRIPSTGSEDYFGRAWGFGSEPDCHAFKGINLGPEPSASSAVPSEWRRVTAYRAHVLDPVHFQESLRLDFTCYGYNRGHRTDEYATVCFWYQEEPHTAFTPLPPIEDLLPLDHAAAFGFGMYQITRAEARRDWASAIAAADALLQAYPRNPKAPDVAFKRAAALEELGRTSEARDVFRAIQRSHAGSDVAQDAADKIWLLDRPGRLLLKAAAPALAEFHLDGVKVTPPPATWRGIPPWGHAQIHRFTYPPFNVAWDSPASAVMRLPTVRLDAGRGRHVLAVKARATEAEPIATPRVGYFFATLDRAGPDVVTDATWKVSEKEEAGWEQADFDDRGWAAAAPHPLAAFGDGAWTWLWPRGFRNFPGTMERIWTPAIYREDKAFRDTVRLRKEFELP